MTPGRGIGSPGIARTGSHRPVPAKRPGKGLFWLTFAGAMARTPRVPGGMAAGGKNLFFAMYGLSNTAFQRIRIRP